MSLILGCGSVGKRVAILENKPTCVCKTVTSQKLLSKQGFDAKALDLTQLKKQPFAFNSSKIYYFIPPPSKGIKDTTISHFINNINPAKVQKILLISTTGVYGNCNGEWIDETQPLKPEADRAKRRVDAEQQLSEFCHQHDIDYTIFRVPGIYGPEKLPISRLENNKPILKLDESPFSNRIHIEDLAQLAFLAMHKTLPQHIYNISDNEPSSMSDYFIKVAKALNLNTPPEISLVEAKKQFSDNMISYLIESKKINNQALLKDINYQLKYPTLEQGLKNIL